MVKIAQGLGRDVATPRRRARSSASRAHSGSRMPERRSARRSSRLAGWPRLQQILAAVSIAPHRSMSSMPHSMPAFTLFDTRGYLRRARRLGDDPGRSLGARRKDIVLVSKFAGDDDEGASGRFRALCRNRDRGQPSSGSRPIGSILFSGTADPTNADRGDMRALTDWLRRERSHYRLLELSADQVVAADALQASTRSIACPPARISTICCRGKSRRLIPTMQRYDLSVCLTSAGERHLTEKYRFGAPIRPARVSQPRYSDRSSKTKPPHRSKACGFLEARAAPCSILLGWLLRSP